MRAQVSNMTSGADGLQSNLSNEMADMKAQIGSLTAQMNETVGQLGGIKDAAARMKQKKDN